MFGFGGSKDLHFYIIIKRNDKRRIPAYLLTCFLTLIIKMLKINVEQGRVVTTLNITIH